MEEKKINEEKLKTIAQFKMFDDTFMSAVFDGRIEETSLLISVILNRDDITVVSVKAQHYITNLYGKESRLDIYANDTNGNAYHFEVQRKLAGASVQRARFLGALVDSRLLNRGMDYPDIPDRYTIFITEKDNFEAGLPVYNAENTIKELNNRPLGDGAHIVYVNGDYRDTSTPIGELMHDFFCDKAEDIINPLLRDRVHYLKDTEGGRGEVCELMDNIINEEKIDMAKDAIKANDLTLEQIAKTLRLPLAFVEELSKQMIVTPQ
ncbi:MAG: PD-(D/E)XK nuclease family transposase [Eubacterium sp.]|nr:PD-(D/E)XK nuclease family transposase [Eubacterium sp.]